MTEPQAHGAQTQTTQTKTQGGERSEEQRRAAARKGEVPAGYAGETIYRHTSAFQEGAQRMEERKTKAVTLFRGQLKSDYLDVPRDQIGSLTFKDAEGKSVSDKDMPEFVIESSGGGQSQVVLMQRHEGDLTIEAKAK